jgi:hypothetical protein
MVTYTQDQIYASKMATEKGLLDIGIAMEKEKSKKEKREKLHKRLLESIRECRNNNITLTRNILKDKFKDMNEYVDLTEEKTVELVKNISILEDQLLDEKEENDNLFEEIIEIEKQTTELKKKNTNLINKIWWYRQLVKFLIVFCVASNLYTYYLNLFKE